MSNFPKVPFRGLIAGLSALPDITIGGQELSGTYLAAKIAVDPEQPHAEAAMTPQLLSELASFVGMAQKAFELAEIDERVWRYTFVESVTIQPGALDRAKALGLVDDSATKPLSKTAAEAAAHTQPEYLTHARKIAELRYALETIKRVFTAAEARTKVIYDYHSGGGGIAPIANLEQAPEPDYDPPPVANRTPIPPAVPAVPPPPPAIPK